MEFLSLLGKQLKGDDVIEVLEWGDMEVVYAFDRAYENQPDKYWASAKNHGVQLGFDAQQKLEVIFLYAMPADGFSAVARAECDIPFFASIAEVEKHGERDGVRAMKGMADFRGVHRHWARLDYAEHALHYEFREGALALVTISTAK